MSEHNETPWYANGHAVYMGADGGFSLRCCPNPEANARHIVHCVNNHEKLVAQLEEAKEFMEVELTGSAWADCRHMAHSIGNLLAKLKAEKGGE